mgnify:CR=1 FL=1
MAIGERIRFFRNLCGMTQKYLGQVVGFPEKTADIRMAQYESGSRRPKADLTNKLAEVFDISPQALSVPDIDSYIGLMHTLFTLEDRYGLTIVKTENGIRQLMALLRSLCTLDVYHVQFNVIDKETLLAAQKKPENYKGLLVRVAGYTAYFTELGREVQDEIIARTAQSNFCSTC